MPHIWQKRSCVRQKLWATARQRDQTTLYREVQILRCRTGTPQQLAVVRRNQRDIPLYYGRRPDPARLQFAIRKINEWYVGDGWYSDGPGFRDTDYYNDYVINPMFVDMLKVLYPKGLCQKREYDDA